MGFNRDQPIKNGEILDELEEMRTEFVDRLEQREKQLKDKIEELSAESQKALVGTHAVVKEIRSELDWMKWDFNLAGFRTLSLAILSIIIGYLSLSIASKREITSGVAWRLELYIVLAVALLLSTLMTPIAVRIYGIIASKRRTK